jgi:hypothetical protein
VTDDVIERLRALADALPEPVKGYEQLERAGDLLQRRQQELTDLWDRDLDLLRAQAKAVRGLRHELSGLSRVVGRAGMKRRGPLGDHGAGRRPRRPRPATAQTAALGRAAANTYANAFARRLGQSSAFRRAGVTAGRALTASIAATATAQTARSFRARERRWAAVGAATGTTIGVTAGARTANVMALKTAVSLFGQLRKVDVLVRAAGTITGSSFGTQAGSVASFAFAANFRPVTPFSVGGGGGGLLGNLLGGMPGLIGLPSVGGIGGLPGIGGLLGGLPGTGPDLGGLAGGIAGGIGDLAGGVPDLIGGIPGAVGQVPDVLRDLGGADGGRNHIGFWTKVAGQFNKPLAAGLFAKDVLSFDGSPQSILDVINGGAGFVLPSWGWYDLVDDTRDYVRNKRSSPGQIVDDLIFEAQGKWPPRRRAGGGVVGSGEVTLVGERGPELVELPSIATVVPAQRTRAALDPAAAGRVERGGARPRRRRDLHVHQVLDGRRIARATLRNIDNDQQWGRR